MLAMHCDDIMHEYMISTLISTHLWSSYMLMYDNDAVRIPAQHKPHQLVVRADHMICRYPMHIVCWIGAGLCVSSSWRSWG